jgi:hypothetical protein
MSIPTMSIPATITISPSSVVMTALSIQAFLAIPSGISGTILWSVDGISGGNSTVGTVETSGNYTSPWQAGNHTVNAMISDGDTTVFANASVRVSTTAPAVVVQTTIPIDASYIGALVFVLSHGGVLYVYTADGWVMA